MQGEDGYAAPSGFGSGFDDIDPNLDPELALVSASNKYIGNYFFGISYRALFIYLFYYNIHNITNLKQYI